jgi:hypothetical protein
MGQTCESMNAVSDLSGYFDLFEFISLVLINREKKNCVLNY